MGSSILSRAPESSVGLIAAGKACHCFDPLCKVHRGRWHCSHSATQPLAVGRIVLPLCEGCAQGDVAFLREGLRYWYGVPNEWRPVVVSSSSHPSSADPQVSRHTIEAHRPARVHGPWFAGQRGEKARGPFPRIKDAIEALGGKVGKESGHNGLYTIKVNHEVYVVVDISRLGESGLKE